MARGKSSFFGLFNKPEQNRDGYTFPNAKIQTKKRTNSPSKNTKRNTILYGHLDKLKEKLKELKRIKQNRQTHIYEDLNQPTNSESANNNSMRALNNDIERTQKEIKYILKCRPLPIIPKSKYEKEQCEILRVERVKANIAKIEKSGSPNNMKRIHNEVMENVAKLNINQSYKQS